MKTLLRRAVGPSDSARRETVVAATERCDGDFHLRHTAAATLARRQRAATRRVWAMVDQAHGVDVHHVADAVRSDVTAAARSRHARADVIAASCPEVPLAIWAADCAPLVLVGARGSVVMAHAGWRGLAAGIVDVAVREIDQRDDVVAAAVLGPVVHPCCYGFGVDDLASVANGVAAPSGEIVGTTAGGARALDVPAAVSAALRRHHVALDVVGSCTSCDPRWFSHRGGDAARQAVVVWRMAPGGDDAG